MYEAGTDRDARSGHGPGIDALCRNAEFRRPPAADRDHGHTTDHLALLYEDRREQFAAAIPFIESGLDRGERCLYVAAENDRERVFDAMRAGDIDVDAALDSGALTVCTPDESYRRGGTAFLEDELDDADGAVRLAGEMTWVLEDPEIDLETHEATLDRLLGDRDGVVLCQYDRSRFPATAIRDVIRTHPHLVFEDRVTRNDHYTPPAAVLGQDDPAEGVERLLGTLRDRADTEAQLTERNEYLRRQVEVATEPSASLAQRLQTLFDLGCERFDLEFGALARVDPETDRFLVEHVSGDHDHLTPGTKLPLSETYCAATVDGGSVSFADPAVAGREDALVHREFGLHAYLGTCIDIDDGPDRTLFFVDSDPRSEPFSPAERTFHELLGQWVEDTLERRQRELSVRRSNAKFEGIFENSHDAIFINDPAADEILEVNPAGCEMFGYDREEILARGPSDFHPDEMERFREFVESVYRNGSGWTDELSCLHRDGHRIPVEISASHIEYDGRQCLLAIVRDISERKERERAQRRLYEIAADPDRPFEEKLQALFDLGCERFDMDFGGLATIDPAADGFTVEALSDDHPHLAPGSRYPLSETYCRVTAEGNGPHAVTDPVREGFEDALCHERFGVEAYLGTRIELEDADDLTFWFISESARSADFTDAERTFHHLMGQWIRYELEHRNHTARLAAVNHLNEVAHDIGQAAIGQSTRADIERVVCERLAASDSYAFAWVGTVEGDEVRPVASANTRGYLDDITVTVDDSPTGRGPTGRAARTGETQVVRRTAADDAYGPWREHALERDIAATAAVPIAYEGRRYGILNVYTTRRRAFGGEEREVISQLGKIAGLAIAAVEHGRELERERERLEFFNRLIRHDLLNSLNVVRARVGVLDGNVDPEMTEHLDTIHGRTNDMIDLIEALRSLMRAIVDHDEHELTPISPGNILRDEVQRARRAFEDAEFHVRGDVRDASPVLADDLLEEVVENLLVNAVQHNDAASPRVVVDIEDGETMTTIHVADNGPGISPEMEDRIFHKGEKSFDSPGTGFGLHLVREIVTAYDGQVSVGESDLGGARFSVSLPQAETPPE